MVKQGVTLSWGKKTPNTKTLLCRLFLEEDKTSHKSSNCTIYTPGNSRKDCPWSGAIPRCRDYGLAEFLGYIIPSKEKDSFMQLLCFLFMITYWSKQGMPSEKQIVLQGAKSTAYLSLAAHRPFFDSVMRRRFTTLLLGLLSSSLPPQPLSRDSGSKSKFWSKLHISLKFTQLRIFKTGWKSEGYWVDSHLLFLPLLLLDHPVFWQWLAGIRYVCYINIEFG